MILGAGQRDIVAIVPDFPHQVFVNYGEDELVVHGALALRLRLDCIQLLLIPGRHKILFSAVERVGSGLHSLRRCSERFEQEA